MEISFVFRLLPIVAFGFLSGCADKDDKVKKEFEKRIVSRFSDSEILEQCGLDGWSDWAYNLEKTDSLISPYLASIGASYDSGETKAFKEETGKALMDYRAGDENALDGVDLIGFKGEIDIRMAYQDDKWVLKKVLWKTTWPPSLDGSPDSWYDTPETDDDGKPNRRWLQFRSLLEIE